MVTTVLVPGLFTYRMYLGEFKHLSQVSQLVRIRYMGRQTNDLCRIRLYLLEAIRHSQTKTAGERILPHIICNVHWVRFAALAEAPPSYIVVWLILENKTWGGAVGPWDLTT